MAPVTAFQLKVALLEVFVIFAKVVTGIALVVTLAMLDVPALPPPVTMSRNWYAVFGFNPVAVAVFAA
jgi:hypothetical protein